MGAATNHWIKQIHPANIATVAKRTIPGYEATTWHGLVTPAGTPSEIVTTLHKAMLTTLTDPEVRKARLRVAASCRMGALPHVALQYGALHHVMRR